MIGAVSSIALLLAIAALHAYWAAGGRFAKAAAIPERDGRPVLKPRSATTLLVALCLMGAAGLIAIRARLVAAPAVGHLAYPATWALAALFALRAIGDFRYVGFFKRIRGTRFARLDTTIYSPLCGLLAFLIADAATM